MLFTHAAQASLTTAPANRVNLPPSIIKPGNKFLPIASFMAHNGSPLIFYESGFRTYFKIKYKKQRYYKV